MIEKSDTDIWNKRFIRNNDIVARKIAGELFLVPIRGKIADMQEIFTLNETAEYIWESIDETMNLGDIRTRLIEIFEVGKILAEADIIECISELLKKELIREQH